MGVIELAEEVTEPVATRMNTKVQPVSIEKKLSLVQQPRSKSAMNDLNEGKILLAAGSTISLPAMERFRMLRAKIERMNLAERKYQVIAVTSAVPQEGKSVTSVNLARALSVDPLGKTIIIDCDLRRPTVHHFFELPREGGIADVLEGGATLDSVIHSVSEGLDVITAGSMVADPTKMVEQPELVEVLEELKKHYRYVIVDCPPVLVCPEPITLSGIVQSTLLVVRAWRTEKRLVHDATHVIGKEKIMGIVMNDGVDASKQYLDYGYYGYKAGTPANVSQ